MTEATAKIADREYDISTPLGAVQASNQMRFTSARDDLIRIAHGIVDDMNRLIWAAKEELHVSTGGIGQQGDRLTEYVTRYQQAAETVRELEWMAGKQEAIQGDLEWMAGKQEVTSSWRQRARARYDADQEATPPPSFH